MKIIPIFFYHEKWAVIMRKFVYSPDGVEKMGPLRGDGNSQSYYLQRDSECREDGSPSWGRKRHCHHFDPIRKNNVEKMGPLRGDGNANCDDYGMKANSREDGSPSWGRKLC